MVIKRLDKQNIFIPKIDIFSIIRIYIAEIDRIRLRKLDQ